jgi:hypothetical protein
MFICSAASSERSATYSSQKIQQSPAHHHSTSNKSSNKSNNHNNNNNHSNNHNNNHSNNTNTIMSKLSSGSSDSEPFYLHPPNVRQTKVKCRKFDMIGYVCDHLFIAFSRMDFTLARRLLRIISAQCHPMMASTSIPCEMVH